MVNRRLVVAAYDIASPQRLKRALDHCTGFATGGQKSVHECWVTAAERAALCAGLSEICDRDADRWMVADLGTRPKVLNLGLGKPPAPPQAVIYLG